MDDKTKEMAIQYENSFGTEQFLKLCLSNLHKTLVEKGVVTEAEL